MGRYHNQFCVASVFSGNCERQNTRDRALWTLYIRLRGHHPIGNKGMGNCFEQGKLIILEEVEGHGIKVR